MRAVFRKELADHFGSTRFLILTSLVLMTAFLGSWLAGQGVREILAGGADEGLRGRTFLLMFTAPGAFLPLSVLAAIMGPLVGLVLGFDAVNRERAQGTLSKILSQPVRRDEVLMGKFLAGLATMAILLTALTGLIVGLALLVAGLAPTAEELARLALWWLLALVYLGFWLGLSILFSIVLRSVATSALAGAAMWLLLTFLVPVLGQAAAAALTPLADPGRPLPEELAAYDRVARLVTLASPPAVFGEASTILLDPTNRGGAQALRLATMSQLDRFLLVRFQGGLSVQQSGILAAPDLMILAAFALATWLGSFTAFARQEVRSA
jgi:ABC-2 type transport system permease protein